MKTEIIGSIVTFNPNWDLLKQTITSFLDAAPTAKVIVWDNSPIDTISTKIQQLNFGEKVEYAKSPGNFGYGKGNNEAFRKFAAGSTYFCVLNPDLFIPKESIKNLVGYLESHPDKGLITGSICGMDGIPHAVHKFLPSFIQFAYNFISQKVKFLPKLKDSNQPPNGKDPYQRPLISGCFMLYRTSHYQELDGFDERFFLYFEDFDISLRSFIAEKSIIIPTVMIQHNWKRESHRNFKIFFIHLKSAFTFYCKWGFRSHWAKKINAKAK